MRNENLSNAVDRYTEVSANIDFKRLVRVLWSRWYWIVAAVLLSLLICYLFLRFSTPKYVASVTLRYDQKKTQLDELSKLVDSEGFNNDEYLTEKFVIESEEVITSAIRTLNKPFTFYRQHTFRREDVYPYEPFSGDIILYDPTTYEHGTFRISQNGIITYTDKEEEKEWKFDVSKNTLISVPGFSFRINTLKPLDEEYIFVYKDVEAIRDALDDKINVTEPEQNLPILEISTSYYNKRFTQDFLESLIKSYEYYNLTQKQKSSALTIKFIQDQVKIYSDALKRSSSTVQNYKQQKSMTDLSSSMTDVTSKMTEYETERNKLEIQKSYIELIEKNLVNRLDPINIASIGLDMTSDAILVKMIADFNEAAARRKDLINRRFNIRSEEIQDIDGQIERIKGQIQSNILAQRQKNDNTIGIINRNINTLKSRISGLPAVERDLVYLESEVGVNTKIYELLLTKQIESSIVKAGILPSFTVLNRTEAYKTYPRAIQVLLLCLALGLLIGIGMIFLMRYLNNTFVEVAKIGQNEAVQLLGITNRYPEKVQNNESDLSRFLDGRSLFTESINNIRTNLSYMAGTESNDDKKGKLLVVTSEVSGEGKSFVTVNLAISLTKINKKVLIIVSDLRRSKLHKFFNNNNKVGLSSYLSGKVDSYNKVIQDSKIEGLSYVPAGPVPLNPTELIQNQRFESMIDECQQKYDYVIIDTAPIGLVSDNVLLLRKSDLVIFIIRWLYSNKEAYMLPDQVAEEYGIKNLGVIVNDFYKDDLYASLAPASYYASRGYGNYYKYNYEYYGKQNNYYAEEKPKNSVLNKIKTFFERKSQKIEE